MSLEVLGADAEQLSVLTLGEGACASVLGAPGTGKTSVIVERVRRLVHEAGWEPDEILVFVPSRTAASALRDRIALTLGRTSNGPLARTAGSVAFQVVQQAVGEVSLLTGAEQDRLLAEIIEGGILDGDIAGSESGGDAIWPESLPPEVRRLPGFRTELRELMMRCTEHGMDSAGLRALGVTEQRPEWIAAAGLLDEYSDIKDIVGAGRYDPAELAVYAAALIRDRPDSLGPLARVRAILVDDAQDATAATIAVVRAFASRGVSVIAAGDPDVASNSFRGGRADLTSSFATALGLGGRSERIVLQQVYRGGPRIRALVHDVSAHIGTALAGTQRKAVAPSGPDRRDAVVRIGAASRAEEAAAIADLLRENHLLHSIPFSDMAVVVRSGSDVAALERALGRADVPTSRSAVTLALTSEPAAYHLAVIASVAIARSTLTPDTAAELLTGPLCGLDAVGLRRLRLALRHSELASGGIRSSDELLVAALESAWGEPGQSDTGQQGGELGRLAGMITAAREQHRDAGSIEEILWAIWERSELARQIGSDGVGGSDRASFDGAEEINRLLDGALALFAAAGRFAQRSPDAPASQFLDRILDAVVPEDTLAPRRITDAVTVATPSDLVGREFSIVVIARLQYGRWPNLKPRGSLLRAHSIADHTARTAAEERVEQRHQVRSDELRLFMLAASRATRQLVLSCVSTEEEQASPLMSLAPEPFRPRQRPLRLRGLVAALRRELVNTDSAEAASALALLAAEGVAGADPACWYGISPATPEPQPTTQQVQPQRVSPSQIEKVEQSPLAWFVDSVGLPPPGVAAAIGTVVHAAVEAVAAVAQEEITADTVWAEIEKRWHTLRFDAGWLEQRERRRVRAIAEGAADYLNDCADEAKILLEAERGFQIRCGDAELAGSIDRVERTPDGMIIVVDLKTGKTVPSASATQTNPQLGAYQIALGDQNVAGAKLVYLASPSGGRRYTERVQPGFTAEEAEQFTERVRAASELMASSRFDGPGELPFGSPFAKWQYRIQLVKAVSA